MPLSKSECDSQVEAIDERMRSLADRYKDASGKVALVVEKGSGEPTPKDEDFKKHLEDFTVGLTVWNNNAPAIKQACSTGQMQQKDIDPMFKAIEMHEKFLDGFDGGKSDSGGSGMKSSTIAAAAGAAILLFLLTR